MSKEFKTTIEKQNTLMIVDGLNLAFRYLINSHVGYTTDYIRTIESLKRSYKAKDIIIACDKGSSSYRKAIYPEYKANRKEKFEKQTDAEKQKYTEFFTEFEHLVDTLAETYTVLRFPEVEADDIAAYITSKVQNNYDSIWLISSDKDWDLLVSEKVSRFSFITRKETTVENWNTHYDYELDKHISIKCLMGDSGDNIAGVPGIGPKRASDLVKTYGSALDIAANIPLIGKYKYIAELNKSYDLIMRNYRLMDLVSFCREALGSEVIKEIDKVIHERKS